MRIQCEFAESSRDLSVAERHRSPGRGERHRFQNPRGPRLRVQRIGTSGMAINLWGASPLYENESLKEGSVPTVTPIDKLLDEGNCNC